MVMVARLQVPESGLAVPIEGLLADRENPVSPVLGRMALNLLAARAGAYEQTREQYIAVLGSRAAKATLSVYRAFKMGELVVHARDVTSVAVLTAAYLDYPPETMEAILVGGLGHDLGKVVLKNIIRKPGRLTEKQQATMQNHPSLGTRYARKLGLMDGKALGVIGGHHEQKYIDPYGAHLPDYVDQHDESHLLDEFIDEQANQVVAVGDSIVSLLERRPYRREAVSPNSAIDITERDIKARTEVFDAYRALIIPDPVRQQDAVYTHRR